jgi:two-component system sensor histidine kinase RegB
VTLANDPPDPEIPAPSMWAEFFPSVPEPRIVLTWLMRLRWLAIIGQLAASTVAMVLGLHVNPVPVLLVVAITAVSNVGLWRMSLASRPIPTGVILAVLLLDVMLLTLLLIATGGPNNPFSTLYLVHVAMAVTTLGGGWTWIVVAAASLGYALLFLIEPVRLSTAPDRPIDPSILRFGLWSNLVLVGALIAYFSSRVNRSLRQRQREIEQLQERNARHEKLATLTTLAAGAAHELGTPLATIALVARELELAISRLPESGELVEDAQLIRQECNRCRFILDRMRVEVASDTRDVSTPLGELMELLAMHLTEGEKSRLQISGPQDGMQIAASCAAIEQSLTVMIRNAMDASPEESPVKLTIRRKGPAITFDVVDQGHGMKPDVLKRAGEPFFTTKEPGRGMGLGLFLVRLVAENYRGSFTLASKPGEGTKSTLELPLAAS